MNPVDRDDVAHALGQTMGFYDKTLDKIKLAFWFRALEGFSAIDIKAALNEHMRRSEYSPKPKHIIAIIRERREVAKATLPPPKPLETHCPPEISAAWAWFIKLHSGYDFGAKPNVGPELQERYLHLVNHEAHRLNNPDAIPDEYKLKEVWG